MVRFGTNIKLEGVYKGTRKGMKYEWSGSADGDYKDTIFFHTSSVWRARNWKYIINQACKVCAHEVIHQILWREKLDMRTTMDVIIIKMKNKLTRKVYKQYRYMI